MARAVIAALLAGALLLCCNCASINLDFLSDETEACVPLEELERDPRASGLSDVLQATGLRDSFKKAMETSGGTLLVPTAEAWTDLLDKLGADAGNLTTVTSAKLWERLLPSYLLSSKTYLPKDVYDALYQTHSGLFMLMAAYRRTDATDDSGPHSLLAAFTSVANTTVVPGRGPRAAPVRYGSSATVSDYSLVCDQYVLYWLDAVPLPFTNPCALKLEGCPEGVLDEVQQALQDVYASASAPVTAPAPDGGGRRLLLEGAGLSVLQTA